MKNKNRFLISFLLTFTIILLTSGCANYKHIPYFQNASEYDGTGKGHLYDMKIMPKDELVIFVNSSSNPAGVAQFNFVEPSSITDRRNTGTRITVTDRNLRHHIYLVDNDGNIEFPVIGNIHLAGLTIEQANALILEKITPYIKDKNDCIVNTLIENYEISVLGEVKRPNTFTIDRNKCTVLEALAMAGDMTIYGKRDNVKLLRELPNGEYEIHELDLRDANLLDSPYYYMQQRDVLYVEPNEVMAQNASIGRTRQLWVRGASITIALGSLLYRVLSN
jgi:polysaccharide export outer membrane protein